MSWQIATQRLRNDADVVSARLAARRIAELLGLERREQTRIATAVSEIVRNAIEHGGGGEIEFGVETGSGDAVFTVQVRDQGPGMPDSPPSEPRLVPALGLQSARRLVDEFDLQSTPGGGVRVICGRTLRSSGPPSGPSMRASTGIVLFTTCIRAISGRIDCSRPPLLLAPA